MAPTQRQLAETMQLELDHRVSVEQCGRIVYARIGRIEASEEYKHHGFDHFKARQVAVVRAIEMAANQTAEERYGLTLGRAYPWQREQQARMQRAQEASWTFKN